MKNSIFKSSGVFIFLILLTVFYFSCDDSGVGPSKKPPFAITGKITGWIQGNRTIVAEAYSISGSINYLTSFTVDTGGYFGVVPPPLADSTLYPTDSIFNPDCNGGPVNFIPPDVRGSLISDFKVFEDGRQVGYIDCNNYNTGDPVKTGDFDVKYVYVNQIIGARGYKLCMGDTVIFYCNANSGWNTVKRLYQRVEPESKTILYLTFIPSSDEVWEYHDITELRGRAYPGLSLLTSPLINILPVKGQFR